MKWKINPKQIPILILLLTSLIIGLFQVYSWVFPSSTTIKILENARFNPTQAQATDSQNIFIIKSETTCNNITFPNRSLMITKDSVGYWINITSGSNSEIFIHRWFTNNITILEYTTTGLFQTDLYVGNKGQPTSVAGADSYTWYSGNNTVHFVTSPSSSQIVYVLWGVAKAFTFHGVFNETTGLPTGQPANVTAYYIDGTLPTSFQVNGTYLFSTTQALLYFDIILPSGENRQYWTGTTETSGEIWLFDETLTTYTFEFLDLAGLLEDNPFVTWARWINGSSFIVEKRKVDEARIAEANLILGAKYNMTIRDGYNLIFGDILMTTDTYVQLTLKALDFPPNIILAYRYVRMYIDRSENYTQVDFLYQDLTTNTINVTNTAYFGNNTVAFTNTQVGVNSYNVTWVGADYSTAYYGVMAAYHNTYGLLEFKTTLPNGMSVAPWGLTFLGILPGGIATSVLIPTFIILCAFGVFSQKNAYVGAFAGVLTAFLLVWFGWITIPSGLLAVALILTILMALGYKRRRYIGG